MHIPPQQEPLRLASNKNNLWNAVEKMVERCWNFLEIFGVRDDKNSIGDLSKCRVYTEFADEIGSYLE